MVSVSASTCLYFNLRSRASRAGGGTGGSGSPVKRGSGPLLPGWKTVLATHVVPDCLAATLVKSNK